MGEKILIVEDEAAIADSVAYSLRRDGYEVLTAADGSEGVALAERQRPDLIVLDISLPGMSGLEVLRALRARRAVAVVLVTARAEEMDRVVGLESGADDYVTKPFSMRELVARVGCVLRRHRPALPDPGGVLCSGDLSLDPGRHLVLRGGRPLPMTRKEFEVLRVLMLNRGAVVPIEAILDSAWDEAEAPDARTLYVYIRWLRRKLEEDPGHPRRITTIRRVGYKFVG